MTSSECHMKSKRYPKWPCMVQINISIIFWYLLVVLTNVSSVRSYARSFVCKNTLQRRKDVVKIFKANLSFLFNFDVVYEKLDPRGVERYIACFSTKHHTSRPVIEKLQSMYWYLCILWGRLACSKLQRCKTVPRGHSTTTWDKFYSI